MPRTLPWLSNSGGGATSSPRSLLATPRPAKRPRTSSSGTAAPSLPQIKASASTTRSSGLPSPSTASETQYDANNWATESVALAEEARAGQARARTPSTSPPPPFDPPAVEYMREGLDADDIWVMVEDEFYDMAKTFTAHLHRAEYERQRQLARERNSGFNGGSSSIPRPVDGKTVLGKDKLRKKEREKQEKERKGKVSRALGGGASASSEGESSDTEKDSDRDPTPRAAPPSKLKRVTSLQGLMISPSKANKSLVGIQGPVLKTRAAAGYTQAQNTPSSSRAVDRLAELARKRSKHATEEEGESTTESEDEDDLDASPTRWSYSPSRAMGSASKAPPKRSPSILKDTLRDIPSLRGPAKSLSRSASVRFEGIDLPVEKSSPLDDGAEAEVAFDGFLRPTPLPNPRNRAGAKKFEQRSR